MDSTDTVTIDDTDPSIMYYSLNGTVDPWGKGGTAGREYNGTTTFSNQLFAAMSIAFSGTGITVLGTWNSNPPSPVFVLDAAAPQMWHGPPSDTFQHYNETFYQSPAGLPAGNHTLHMVLVQPETIWIDYMNIIRESQSSATSSTTTVTTRTPTSSPTSISGPVLNATSRASVIASGVLGGVLFLLFLFAILSYIRRHRCTEAKNRAESLVLVPLQGNIASGSVAGSAMSQEASLIGRDSSHLPGTVVMQPRLGKAIRPMPPPATGAPPEYSEHSRPGSYD